MEKVIKGFGKIPSDWDIVKLREISSLITKGATPTTYGFEWQESGIPFFKSDCIKDGRFVYGAFKYIDSKAHEQMNRSKTQRGDLLISITGDVGKVAVVPKNIEEANINQHIAKIRINKSGVENNFVYHWLNQSKIRSYYNVIKTGLAYPQISLEQVRDTEIPLPNIHEQSKITSILSTWDKAIDLKEKLIGQKKEKKKELMQKLLTGKVRINGYKEEWKEVTLGSVFKERKDIGYENLELLAITSQKGVVKRSEVNIKDTSSEDKSKYKRICPNDIGYNTMRMWQGVSGVSKYEGIVSPAYTILIPTKNINSQFMGYLFKLPTVINLFKRFSQGLVDDTLNLKYENFKIIKVKIPGSLQEQEMIAEILNTLDEELSILNYEKELIHNQKQGLIQNLLTGKIRVKV
ncbi:restriction endonuclease subunit S [Lysinibacillus sp. FSL K6-1151]|uniref:restriction endonuclease subunit S n=1 Tax=Lysinibacillus sp. FSL K6-1151 TaxID=2921465 RepID=UPI00315A9448